MKTLRKVGIIFSIVGIICLIAFSGSVINTKNLIDNAIHTTGEVIDYSIVESKDENGRKRSTFYPIVQFIDDAGNDATFIASYSSSGPQKGDIVNVMYESGKPEMAKLSDSFMDLWGVSLITGIFALLFCTIGFSTYFYSNKDKRNAKRAQFYTRIIKAKVNGSFIKRSFKVNGRSPYYIEAQWLDLRSNEMHIFNSEYIWYDPTNYLPEEVTIKTDRDNIKKYWMDVSFLPKRA